MEQDNYRDLLDQKRVNVGGNRSPGRGPMQNSQARKWIEKQRDKGKYRRMGRSR